MKTIQQTFVNTVTLSHIFSREKKRGITMYNIFLLQDKGITYLLNLSIDNRYREISVTLNDLCPCCIEADERKAVSDFVESGIADGSIDGAVRWPSNLYDFEKKMPCFPEFVLEHYGDWNCFGISKDAQDFLNKEALPILQGQS